MIHMYNAITRIPQIVFDMSKDEVRVNLLSRHQNGDGRTSTLPGCELEFLSIRLEVFSTTEPEFAVEVCNAVAETYGATADKKIVFNSTSNH